MAVNPLPASVYHGLARHTDLEEAAPEHHQDGRLPNTAGVGHHHGTRTTPCANWKSQSFGRCRNTRAPLLNLLFLLPPFLFITPFSLAFCPGDWGRHKAKQTLSNRDVRSPSTGHPDSSRSAESPVKALSPTGNEKPDCPQGVHNPAPQHALLVGPK